MAPYLKFTVFAVIIVGGLYLTLYYANKATENVSTIKVQQKDSNQNNEDPTVENARQQLESSQNPTEVNVDTAP